jgi:mRNA-degrading endonuclease RelE of RelBE toxin-antitoxin system
MQRYQIKMTEEAKTDFSYYSVFERKLLVSEIRGQLTYEPKVETRNRRLLRDNPVGSWELRVGKYRVFYEVDETTQTVTIVAVGYKEHGALLIRGKEVRI